MEEARFRKLLLASDTHGVCANVHDWAAECGFIDRRGNWNLLASDGAIIHRIEQAAEYLRSMDR